jgi:hypothetical protein
MASSNKSDLQSTGVFGDPDWLNRLDALLANLATWANEMGWDVRRIEKVVQDAELGPYQAPALLMQRESVRIIAEPISRSSPGAQGVVDLYLLPAFDDIASLYFLQGVWRLHYMFPHSPTVGDIKQAESKSLDKASFAKVIDAMTQNAVRSN